MINEIIKTKDFMQNLESYILKSSYKVEHIIKRLGVTKPTYYKKLHENKFSVNELLLIGSILFPDEYQAELLKMEIETSISQYEKGETMTTEEVFNQTDKLFS